MRIFLVCSTAKNWMATGYGASLLAGDANRLLVSFVEFTKNPDQQLAVSGMPNPYVPSQGKANPKELAQAFTPLLASHAEEIFDEGDSQAEVQAPKTRVQLV